MLQPDSPAMLAISCIEVGGLRLPLVYRYWRMINDVQVTIRYSRDPYVHFACQTLHRGATVVLPESTPEMIIHERERVPKRSRRRSYTFTGTIVNETVRLVSDATTVEEIGIHLAPYIAWVRTFPVL